MPILHIFWDDHQGSWPPEKTGRRWTDVELRELQAQLNRVGLSQVSDAIGSLMLDRIRLGKAPHNDYLSQVLNEGDGVYRP